MIKSSYIINASDPSAEQALADFVMAYTQDTFATAGYHYYKHWSDTIFAAVEAQDKPAVYAAVQNAKEAGLPDGIIKIALDSATSGLEEIPFFQSLRGVISSDALGSPHAHVIVSDPFIEAALTGSEYRPKHNTAHSPPVASIRAAKVLDTILAHQWQGMRICVSFFGARKNKVTHAFYLPDYISQNGEIDFVRLAEGVSYAKAFSSIELAGLNEALLKLDQNILTGEGLNLAMALVLLVQGYAVDDGFDTENKNDQNTDLKRLSCIVKGEAQSILGADAFNVSILKDKKLKDTLRQTWQAIDIQLSKSAVNFVPVSIADTDAFMPLSHILGYDENALDPAHTTFINPAFLERLQQWGYNEAVIHAFFDYLRNGNSCETAPMIAEMHRLILAQPEWTLDQQICITGAIQSVCTGAVHSVLEVPSNIKLQAMKSIFIKAYGNGMRYIDLYRPRSGLDAPMFASDIDEALEHFCDDTIQDVSNRSSL